MRLWVLSTLLISVLIAFYIFSNYEYIFKRKKWESLEQGNLEKEYIRYKQSCDNIINIVDCYKLDVIQTLKKNNKRIDKAKQIYKDNCNTENIRDCYKLGFINGHLNSSNGKKFYLQSCKDGKSESCSILGSIYRVEGNLVKAGQFYRKACDSKKGSVSCFYLGKIEMFLGSFLKAEEIYKKSCEDGEKKSCYKLGEFEWNLIMAQNTYKVDCNDFERKDSCKYLWNSDKLESSRIRAKFFFQRSWERGEIKSCYYLGLIDREKGKELCKKSCENEEFLGCYYLGKLSYSSKKLIPGKQSQNLYEKSCEGGEVRGCIELGDIGLKINDLSLSKKFYTKACYNKEVKKCDILVGLGFLTSNEEMLIYEKACKAGYKRGCYLLGKFLINKKRGQLDEIIYLYKKSWMEGYVGACFNLGLIDENKGKRLCKASCDSGDVEGCHYLGQILESHHSNFDTNFYEKLKTLYQNSCYGGSQSGCYFLGVLEKKMGNLNKAKNIFKKGCDLTGGKSCLLY